MKNSPIKFITRSAVVAAVYFALSAACSPIAFGPLQFRLSEAFVLLAALMPEAIPGLTIGCVLTNFAFSPYSLYDMLFGGLATLLGAGGTYLLRKNIALSSLPPIILNALLVPVIWVIDGSDTIYIISALEILASEAVTIGIIGIPLTYALKRAFIKAGVIGKQYAIPYRRQTKLDQDTYDDDLSADLTPKGTKDEAKSVVERKDADAENGNMNDDNAAEK